MRNLYININGAQVENSEEIKVIKPDSGSILNDFLYSLGEIITEGVPNVSGINLVKLFTNADGYDDFVSQWKAIEPLLFAEEPVSGKRDISIPDKYLHWLRHQNVEVLQGIYEAIKDREAITIDLENFYDDSIGELQAKIVRYLKTDTSIETVQFSSSLVTRKSQIVRYLKKRFENAVFVPYKKNGTNELNKTDNHLSSKNIENKEINKIPIMQEHSSTLHFQVKGFSIEMVYVSAGSYMMGAHANVKYPHDWDKPVHEVEISTDFYIGKTLVTQGLWNAIMCENPSFYGKDLDISSRERADLPVEHISWDDCQRFIHRINNIIGERFRLPTEAEWEFAARGGNKSKDYIFSGSNNYEDVAWLDGKTHPVAQKMPNELGIYDMSGNVAEWCEDWLNIYTEDYIIDPLCSIPKICTDIHDTPITFRVTRGGDCESYRGEWRLPVSARSGNPQNDRISTHGIRLALTSQK